jgi:mannose-6-phosphate isomerase-like protein (cupin superfamily)
MSQATYLGGSIRKQSLPVIEGRPGPDAPNLKRIRLAQGELSQIHNSGEAIRYLAALELRAGAVRGNHYHKIKEEFIYVIEGELLIAAADMDSAERASISLEAGDLCVIQPGIAHALRTVRAGQALEFSPAPFDPSDQYPFSLG